MYKDYLAWLDFRKFCFVLLSNEAGLHVQWSCSTLVSQRVNGYVLFALVGMCD